MSSIRTRLDELEQRLEVKEQRNVRLMSDSALTAIAFDHDEFQQMFNDAMLTQLRPTFDTSRDEIRQHVERYTRETARYLSTGWSEVQILLAIDIETERVAEMPRDEWTESTARGSANGTCRTPG